MYDLVALSKISLKIRVDMTEQMQWVIAVSLGLPLSGWFPFPASSPVPKPWVISHSVFTPSRMDLDAAMVVALLQIIANNKPS